MAALGIGQSCYDFVKALLRPDAKACSHKRSGSRCAVHAVWRHRVCEAVPTTTKRQDCCSDSPWPTSLPSLCFSEQDSHWPLATGATCTPADHSTLHLAAQRLLKRVGQQAAQLPVGIGHLYQSSRHQEGSVQMEWRDWPALARGCAATAMPGDKPLAPPPLTLTPLRLPDMQLPGCHMRSHPCGRHAPAPASSARSRWPR